MLVQAGRLAPSMFAPYQVQLDDGRLIFAPDDANKCIRAEGSERMVLLRGLMREEQGGIAAGAKRCYSTTGGDFSSTGRDFFYSAAVVCSRATPQSVAVSRVVWNGTVKSWRVPSSCPTRRRPRPNRRRG